MSRLVTAHNHSLKLSDPARRVIFLSEVDSDELRSVSMMGLSDRLWDILLIC
jgi:hypothetical protein